MRRIALLAAAALPLLGGCPIPQPLAEVSKTGTTFTPPRIFVDVTATTLAPLDTVVPYETDTATCVPEFQIKATVIDDNTDEIVGARWFVDYATAPASPWIRGVDLSPDADEIPPPTPAGTVRTVPTLTFRPTEHAGNVHVVELVVSNGFATGPGQPLPNRSPAPQYEVQMYRWMFVGQAGSGRCN